MNIKMLIKDLPLPVSGKIKYICHISDIHIRSGTESKDDKFSRYTEYISVFRDITKYLHNNYTNKDVVVCITGDILHDNKKAGAPCIELFYEIIGMLSDIAPVYIIRGNHDFNQASIHSQDMLKSLMYGTSHRKNVAYLSETGQYNAGNVSFGVSAIQDVLESGNTCGVYENLPEFPKTSKFQDCKEKTVALFHGNIYDHTSLKWILDGSNYDFALLGDLHCQQVSESTEFNCTKHSENIYHMGNSKRNKNNNTFWGYAGSTVQQNFGESLLNHGFIMWDLYNNEASCYHVKNNYGFITAQLDDKSNKILYNISYPKEQKVIASWHDIEYMKAQPWIPTVIRLRIQRRQSHTITDTQQIFDELEQNGFKIESSKETLILEKDTSNTQECKTLEEFNLQKYNNPDSWCGYVDEFISHDTITYSNWKEWFYDAKSLFIDSNNCPAFVDKDVGERNKKIQASLDEYRQDADFMKQKFNTKLELLYMNWSYILCFDANCYFNFQELNGNVHCIGGKNGYGKTSFFETICIALFGESLPTRSSKQMSSSIICMHLTPQSKHRAFTSIVIKLDNTMYKIVRSFSRVPKDENKIQTKDTVIEQYNQDTNQYTALNLGKRAVAEWINNHIGGIDTFLTSCMITQTADNEFFSKKSAEQKMYLDNQLKLNTSNSFLNLLKTAKLAFHDISSKISNVIESKLDNDTVKGINIVHQSLNESEQRYKNICSEIQFLYRHKGDLLSLFVGFDTNLFSCTQNELLDNIESINEQITKLQTDLPENISSDEITQELYSLKNKLKDTSCSTDDFINLKKQLENHIANKPCYEKPHENIAVLSHKLHVLNQTISKQEALVQQLQSKTNLIETKNKELKEVNWKLSCLQNHRNEKRAKQTEEQSKLSDMLSKTPENPKITEDDYINWKNKINKFQQKYSSIEDVESLITNHYDNKPKFEETSPEHISSLLNILNMWHNGLKTRTSYKEIFNEFPLNEQLLTKTIERINNNVNKLILDIRTSQSVQEKLSSNSLQFNNCLNSIVQVLESKFDSNKITLCKNTIAFLPQYISKLELIQKYKNGMQKVLHVFDKNNREHTSCINEFLKEETTLLQNANTKCKLNCHNVSELMNMFKKNQLVFQEINKLEALKELINSNSNDLDIKNIGKLIEKNEIEIETKTASLNQHKQNKAILENILSEWVSYYQDLYSNFVLCKESCKAWTPWKEKLQTLVDDKTTWSELCANETLHLESCKQRTMFKSWKNDINNINNVISKLSDEYSDVNNKCLECSQKLHDVTSYVHREKELLNELQKEDTAIDDLKSEWKHEKDIHDKLQTYLEWEDMLNVLNEKLFVVETCIKFDKYQKMQSSLLQLQTLNEELTNKQKCLELYPKWVEFLDTEKQTCTYIEKKQTYATHIALLKKQISDYEVVKKEIDDMDKYYKKLHSKLSTITNVIEVFSNFKDWYLDSKVIPVITSNLNDMLKYICENHRPIYMKCEFDKTSKALNWLVNDGEVCIPFEKASGFQKCAINLAMRIVLGKLGVYGIKNTQLFIDEGFTSCDSDNIENIPFVLQKLLQNYSAIFIVTHLDILKQNIQNSIDITRNEQAGLSHIEYGNKVANFDTTKKVGRPKAR